MAKASKKTANVQEPATPPPAPVNVALLKKIVAATKSPPGFTYAAETDLALLEKLGLVEVNAAFKDSAGNLTVRASGTAEDYLENIGENEVNAPVQIMPTVSVPSSDFVIDDDVAMPATGRKGRRGASKYPFDALQVGQSFHIPATPDMPNPAKELATGVSGANKRFAYNLPETEVRTFNRRIRLAKGVYKTDPETGAEIIETKTITGFKQGYNRHFVIRPVTAADPRGVGARVFRDK